MQKHRARLVPTLVTTLTSLLTTGVVMRRKHGGSHLSFRDQQTITRNNNQSKNDCLSPKCRAKCSKMKLFIMSLLSSFAFKWVTIVLFLEVTGFKASPAVLTNNTQKKKKNRSHQIFRNIWAGRLSGSVEPSETETSFDLEDVQKFGNQSIWL